jgi:predicted NAD/FAD-binding protein
MQIAIIGSGISGLVAARELSSHHEVTVFEADSRPGGHTHTVNVSDEAGTSHSIDTGFMVCNERNYPGLFKIFKALGVALKPTDMSFSVRCDQTGVEWNGTSVNQIFSQRRNLFRPSFHGMIKDILRFQAKATAWAEEDGEDQTVIDFVQDMRLGQRFLQHYLIPLGSSLWSSPPADFLRFSMRFLSRFLNNHGMLSWSGRPQWMTVMGGSSAYLSPMMAPFRSRVHLNTPVRSVVRNDKRVRVRTEACEVDFDEVVFACHSVQALKILAHPDPKEANLLGAIRFQPNDVVLHSDVALLPRRRRAWASWNYCVPMESPEQATVTYNMNMLQGIQSSSTFCVSLNGGNRIRPERVLKQLTYHHPIFSMEAEHAKRHHADVIRNSGISFCGAYWGQGFHEDGVQSALRVAKAFEEPSS